MSKAARRKKEFREQQETTAPVADQQEVVVDEPPAPYVLTEEEREFVRKERSYAECREARREKNARRSRVLKTVGFFVLWAVCSFATYLFFSNPTIAGSYALAPAIVVGGVAAGIIVGTFVHGLDADVYGRADFGDYAISLLKIIVFLALWAGCFWVLFGFFSEPSMMGSYALFPAVIASLILATILRFSPQILGEINPW